MEFGRAWEDELREVEQAHEIARNIDPWFLPLSRLKGKIDLVDGLERISSQKILDLLEVPQENRRAPVYRRISRLMAQLDWTPIRIRDLTGCGFKEQVRGYCRQPVSR